jgi:hypothetical protein
MDRAHSGRVLFLVRASLARMLAISGIVGSYSTVLSRIIWGYRYWGIGWIYDSNTQAYIDTLYE